MPWMSEMNRNPGMDLFKNESQEINLQYNEKLGKWAKNQKQRAV